MSNWQTYPHDYRQAEVQTILTAIQAGDCVAVIGLSGAGKSNLLGFLANRSPEMSAGGVATPHMVLVDCNSIPAANPNAFWTLLLTIVDSNQLWPAKVGLPEVEIAIKAALKSTKLCLLIDRFEVINEASDPAFRKGIVNNLRALRDLFKYDLTYVFASRQSFDPHSELAELFYGHTLWLGPLSASDASWSVTRYAQRRNLAWDEATIEQLIELSGGYPALLRAVCEAHAGGAPLVLSEIAGYPAVQQRLSEFWASNPEEDVLTNSHLDGIVLLQRGRSHWQVDTSQLTQKEHLLWDYLSNHPQEVCVKDDLIRAVWPEDQVYLQGIRDDSLAQLVRRLREKVEAEPSSPQLIQTVPGRGYRFTPG